LYFGNNHGLLVSWVLVGLDAAKPTQEDFFILIQTHYLEKYQKMKNKQIPGCSGIEFIKAVKLG
jgi:hypothetical protein